MNISYELRFKNKYEQEVAKKIERYANMKMVTYALERHNGLAIQTYRLLYPQVKKLICT